MLHAQQPCINTGLTCGLTGDLWLCRLRSGLARRGNGAATTAAASLAAFTWLSAQVAHSGSAGSSRGSRVGSRRRRRRARRRASCWPSPSQRRTARAPPQSPRPSARARRPPGTHHLQMFESLFSRGYAQFDAWQSAWILVEWGMAILLREFFGLAKTNIDERCCREGA